MSFKVFRNGLITGLFLQLAIGPVFFYIINLALQRTIFDGLIAVLAVTIVDYFYISLSIFGIGKLLEKKKVERIFGIISSIVLMVFGGLILKDLWSVGITAGIEINSMNLLASFLSVFILTISSPMTIVFFTSIFAAKAIEYNYTKKQLYVFGLAVGSATLVFMGASVLLFFLLKAAIPLIIIQILNLMVGIVLVGYGGTRLVKILKN
ncbi:hypothetical protein CMI42_01690 [Candidatus Pacearchaeota archaeon]|nr:hypothetical protein [Candidatus Pacearchaeota archaeon]|tara:strand:- start:311 stop:934 length:624 start_codon:yes stop_codon:yes gene_type:complete